jgi:RNA polymerase-associated protein CTR9
MDDAMRSFDGVLATKPTNLVALLGKVRKNRVHYHILTAVKARILYARRNFKEALKVFQEILRYNPRCIPDPRIGIGLCLWALDHKGKARDAWQRSLEVVRRLIFVFVEDTLCSSSEPIGMGCSTSTGPGSHQFKQE